MRTASTKQLEQMSFERLSSWSIIAGATRELYRRYDAEAWTVVAGLEFCVIIWMKLG